MTKSSIPGGPWTLEGLKTAFPWIPWERPQVVRETGHLEECHYACPVCVANEGLRGQDVPDLPRDPQVVREHIALEHRR